jgi:hypothetical protein
MLLATWDEPNILGTFKTIVKLIIQAVHNHNSSITYIAIPNFQWPCDINLTSSFRLFVCLFRLLSNAKLHAIDTPTMKTEPKYTLQCYKATLKRLWWAGKGYWRFDHAGAVLSDSMAS